MNEVLKLFCLFLLINIITSKVNDRYYPRYHLAPPHGSMNDPSGFCFYRDEFHLFYQFNPDSSLEPGIANWGHAKSKDLFHWEHLPIALKPKDDYEKSGVLSGSAIIVRGNIYIYYTGNVDMPGNDPDHKQVQAFAVSNNGGVRFLQYIDNPIIDGENLQPDFRNPKVWAPPVGGYYMVLGNSFNNNTLGRALLYKSKDVYNWNKVATLFESDGSLGYMWENPDFFEIGGKFVLLFSPQGIEPDGDNYRNLYQTGYIVGDFDYKSNVFNPLTSFVELDHGHDFYTTQTIKDNGRRILVAWLDMREQDYPERQDGWSGQMSIPRELSLTKDNVLIQKPVNQVALIRRKTLYNGNNRNHEKILLSDKAGEIRIRANNSESFDLIIESSDDSANVTLRYDHSLGTVSLDRGGEDGVRTAKWKPNGVLKWQVFIDASSIELFCGDGELTFSSRFFSKEDVSVRSGNKSRASSFIVRSLDRSVAKP